MNRLPFCLIVAAAFVPSTLADEPKSKAAIEFEGTWLKKHADDVCCKRIGGVLLTSTARLDGENLRIDWTLHYDGPRPPLIILKPMYPENNFGATDVRILFPDPKRVRPTGITPVSVVLNQFGSRWPDKTDPRPTRNAYITVKKGETATGTILVALTNVKQKLTEKKTLINQDQMPLEIYVHLIHRPALRGGEFGLDAWTVGPLLLNGRRGGPIGVSELHSVPELIVIKNW